jgi:hypothetical protein
MTHRDLAAGQKYRVVKSGAYLAYEIPKHGPRYTFYEGGSIKLSEGDVVEYCKTAYGGGSDDVYYTFFSKDGQTGKFWPNNWGMCDLSFLELVSN